MKTFNFLLATLLCLAPLKTRADQTAQARLFCLSLRFQRGMDAFGLYALDLSTISLNAPNGELAPTFTKPDHSCGFRISDLDFGDVVEEGEIDLNTPSFTDVNGNGFDDFFEVGQAVSAASSGIYSSVIDSGMVAVTWNRAAGSAQGTCILTLASKMGFGKLGDFTHPFELIEYTGPMNYAPDTNRTTGTIKLTQTGDPSSQMTGPFYFLKSSTNRLDELNLQHSTWTNALGGMFDISNDIDAFLRDLVLQTNYYGIVDFDDGDLSTTDGDYYTWILSIDDPNDSNGNGTPDFSDDPALNSPLPPLLDLGPASMNLNLSISGTVGRTHEVQEISSLSETNWTTVATIILTNSPQLVSLPLTGSPTRFWRVLVR